MRGIAVLVAVVLVAGCSTAAPQPGAPALEDENLREVRMTSGLALGYVQPETSAQILCQLLDRAGWQRLLDSDELGRKPVADPASCRITTETGTVRMGMHPSWEPFAADTTVAGRPATVETPYCEETIFTVALSDDALRQSPRNYPPVRTLLELTVGGAAQREVGTRVLTTILPMLMAPGETLPTIDDWGSVTFVPTPVTGQFVDLPAPVQAVQLCSLLLDERPDERDINVNDSAQCEFGSGADHAVIAVQRVYNLDDFTDRVAGRPAATLDRSLVRVLLQDDTDVGLWISATDAKAVAEKLVPRLVG